MTVLNFESILWDPNSLLLCSIGTVGNNPQIPGNIPVDDPNVLGAEKSKQTEGNVQIPPAEDKEGVGDKKIPLEEPKKDITDQNTKSLLSQMDSARNAILSITDLLQAIIKMNRERKDMEIKMLWSECENVCNNIQSQADNMRKDALKNLIVGLACSTVSIACGGLSIMSSVKGLKDLSAAKAELNQALSVENITDAAKGFAYQEFSNVKTMVDNRTQFWNAISDVCKAASQGTSSLSEYYTKRMEAGNKELDATNEVLRTAMEEIKKCIDDARNSITSSQQNINEMLQTNRQTLNKVMG